MNRLTGDDEATAAAHEAQFLADQRAALPPIVRLFGLVTAVVVIAYAALNAVSLREADRFVALALGGAWLALAAGYAGATFWRGYLRHPEIDFGFLLAMASVLTLSNMAILQTIDRLAMELYADADINRMILSVFAAVVLAGRTRLFLAWLALHFSLFVAMVPLAHFNPVINLYELLSYLTAALAALFINWALGNAQRRAFALRLAVDRERARNEELLYNVLPPAAAVRLKAGQLVADSFADASVVFIDIVGFSGLAKQISPGQLLDLLNGFFGLADRAAGAAGVEKVKTIGDAYLAISGGNAPAGNTADAAIAFGRGVIAGLPALHAATGIAIQVRIGIHSGPVVGGVIGATRLAYDYWGETMNIASRVEGTAAHNGIAISEATYLRARDRSGFSDSEVLVLKGVGETRVYRSAPPA